MSVSKKRLEEAENEAKIVYAEMEKQFKEVREKHKNEQGMDRGAKEIKAITQAGMKKIAEIRKKYGIEDEDIKRSDNG